MLKFNAKIFNINVHVNIMKVSNFSLKCNLKMILHILMQCVNNLIVMIIIYKTHNSLNYVIYTIVIIYFKKLIKYFNAEEMINVIKTTLFNNYFNE